MIIKPRHNVETTLAGEEKSRQQTVETAFLHHMGVHCLEIELDLRQQSWDASWDV